MADGRNPVSPLLNGASLSSLAGAVVDSSQQTSVRLPANSMAEVLETIHRLGHTGQLQVNFHKGRALDLKFVQTRGTRPADV
jgi:hypothetical protein